VRPNTRGGPTEFARRRERAAQLATTPGVEQPLAVLGAVLAHQEARLQDATVVAAAALIGAGAGERAAIGTFAEPGSTTLAADLRQGGVPLLDVGGAADAVNVGITAAVRDVTDAVAVPEPLLAAARMLEAPAVRAEAVPSWLVAPALVDEPLAFWIGVAAQPILELAALDVQAPGPDQWAVATCPVCGGVPQVSAIAEESGEFMAGAPRSLICGRCAGRWAFPRALCVACGENDSRRIGGWVADNWPVVRIEACDTCRAYIKTFDLRRPGSRDVVPLVDDVATAVLDRWARDQGLQRPVRSLAGV
jgi:formate dehydrogenase maturation protein FdhE